jgi:N-hydroxyarylamine O-acetyltransferase
MLAVPFENLDIHLGHPIRLSLPSFYDKIVRRRRGGFCYELNGLFGWLLEQLGFRVVLSSGRVFDGAQPGPEFDHLVLIVEMEERLVADVGFGDSFLEPLRLDADEEVEQYGSSYRFTRFDSARILERRRESDWEPQYVFSLTPRHLSDFDAMCLRQQTSPESHFTRKTICSLATPDGRITMSNNRLIVTTGRRREEREVASEEEYRKLLTTQFGIDLGKEVRIDRLMTPGVPVSENEHLFSYGTLQLESVQLATFGRRLTGTPDALQGFAQRMIEIDDPAVVETSGKTHHPIVVFTGNATDLVPGVVFVVSADELRHADEYETSAYTRIAVALQSGARAWVYVDGRYALPSTCLTAK